MRAVEPMLWASLAMAAQIATFQPFDRNAHISEAVSKVRAVAMNADKVDWPEVQRDALRRTEGAKDSVDLLPAYYLIVSSLKDHHSNMIPTDPQFQTWMVRYNGRRFLPDTPIPERSKSRFAGRKPEPARRVPLAGGSYATLVTITASNARDEDHRYADAIYNGVGEARCGLIVDLRGNTGGNTFPMLAGLSALLGDGFHMDVPVPRGQPHSFVVLREGVTEGHIDGAPAVVPLASVSHWSAAPALSTAPVAVLIDDATASAGEGVAVAFQGRPNTRFFGMRTAGAASANEVITLSDGVVLAVTVALLVDRNGKTYPDGVEPDVLVTPPTTLDAPLTAATNWLGSRATCSARNG